MKASREPLQFLAFVGRTALALFCFVSVLWLARTVPSYLINKYWRPRPDRHTLPDGGGRLPAGKADASVSDALWGTLPRYPAIAQYKSRAFTVNGKTMVFGGILARASADDIIDYYLHQMIARGWRDVTEDFFNIGSRNVDGRELAKAMQDPRKVEKYARIRRTNAVLRRGNRSLYITLSPADMGCQRINVILADCPSLKEFWYHVIASEERSTVSGNAKPFLEVFDHETGPFRRRVELFSGSGSPHETALSIARDMADNGWEFDPEWGPGGSHAGNEYFLTKGNLLVLVTASRDPRTGQSQAMVVTVEGS